MKNKEIPLQINLKKLDSETNEYVAGAEYALYAREDITNVMTLSLTERTRALPMPIFHSREQSHLSKLL